MMQEPPETTCIRHGHFRDFRRGDSHKAVDLNGDIFQIRIAGVAPHRVCVRIDRIDRITSGFQFLVDDISILLRIARDAHDSESLLRKNLIDEIGESQEGSPD